MRVKWLQSTLIVIVSLSLLTVCFAQSPPRKKKPIKDFGSSLKGLKSKREKPTQPEPTPAKTQDQEIDEEDVIRTDTSLVSCELLVIDRRGNHVPGLTAEDFLITDNNEPQTVGHFGKGDNVNIPRTIVLVIDYSGSQVLYLKNSVAAAKVLVDKLGPSDLMAIVTDDIELLADFTNDKKKLKDKLDSLVKKTKIDDGFGRSNPKLGGSAQYSALMVTLNEAFDHDDLRPIVIFQTDGDEAVLLRDPVVSHSIPASVQGESLERAKAQLEQLQKYIKKNVRDFSLEDLYRTVERSRATVYTVIPGPKLLGLTPDEQWKKAETDEQMRLAYILASAPPESRNKIMWGLAATANLWRRNNAEHNAKLQDALSAVAPLSGGWTEFLEQPEQADKIYARIFSDITQRYIVGYYPTSRTRDGKRRKIDFQVKGHPEYQILGRRSYFAPIK